MAKHQQDFFLWFLDNFWCCIFLCKHRRYHQKMTLRARPELQKLPCFWLGKNLKFKMWEGVPFGRLQKPKMAQKEPFFGKITAQKRCKYQLFCFLWLVAMESVIFELVGFYAASCMCFQKHWYWSKNTVKYSILDMLCCESVANSVFLLRLLFWVLHKHRILARFWAWGRVLVGQENWPFPAHRHCHK